MNANVLLFNTYLLQASPFEQVPLSATIREKTHGQLEDEVKRLENILNSNQPSFNPKIYYVSEEGDIADIIANVIKKESVMMMVKGGQFDHDEDDLLGDEFLNILKKVRLPVLIVPEYR